MPDDLVESSDLAPTVGDEVEYLESGVFDNLIVRGDREIVREVEDGWVHVDWTSGRFSVPVDDVRVTQPRSASSPG